MMNTKLTATLIKTAVISMIALSMISFAIHGFKLTEINPIKIVLDTAVITAIVGLVKHHRAQKVGIG